MLASPTSPRPSLGDSIRGWLDRWADLLPLLIAEFVVWLGFGGLLPVLPLYFIEHGVDLVMLGFVVAAWPAARLVTEPAFGWLANRVDRVPLMLVGLVASGLFGALPLVFTGPAAFLVLRAGAGLSAACYDPAARGFLTDATPPGRRGEAFGLYGAAQMGGLILGPAIAAFGAERFGGIAFVFASSGIAAVLAALLIAWRVREPASPDAGSGHTRGAPWLDATELPAGAATVSGRAAAAVEADRRPTVTSATDGEAEPAAAPDSLWNRGLLAAMLVEFGGYFSAGTYEVIWSLFLERLGADLTFIGITFALFGVPVLVLSPIAGRLVDRRGALGFVVAGSILPAIAALTYTVLTQPLPVIPLILMEGTGFALLNPALYAVVAASSPPGRSSSAQGWFGAAGTLGFIVASILAGTLAASDIRYPFYVFAIVLVASLIGGVAIGGRRMGLTRASEATEAARGAEVAPEG